MTWGFIQEKVMTQRYDTGMFPSTVFLVCANRALALVVAGARRAIVRRPFTKRVPCVFLFKETRGTCDI